MHPKEQLMDGYAVIQDFVDLLPNRRTVTAALEKNSLLSGPPVRGGACRLTATCTLRNMQVQGLPVCSTANATSGIWDWSYFHLVKKADWTNARIGFVEGAFRLENPLNFMAALWVSGSDFLTFRCRYRWGRNWRLAGTKLVAKKEEGMVECPRLHRNSPELPFGTRLEGKRPLLMGPGTLKLQ